MKKVLKFTGIGLLVVLGVGLVWLLLGPLGFVLRGGANLPKPTGPYDVGKTRIALRDESRDEIFTVDDPNDKREYVIEVYYPAVAPADAQPGAWMEPSTVQAVTGVPAFLVAPITPSWIPDAPAADGEFPVLMFTGGWVGPNAYYSTLIGEIVSQGYVVVAIEPTYSFYAVAFPDGRVVEWNDYGQAEGDYESEEDKETITAVWVDDVIYALDEITALNETHSIFGGHLDLSRVGAFGHSFGGQTAAVVTLVDDRVQAGINYDGSFVDNRVVEQGIGKPFLLFLDDIVPPYDYLADVDMSLDEWWTDFKERNYPEAVEHDPNVIVLQYEGAAHDAFSTDLPILQPMFPMLITEDVIGTVEGTDALETVSAYTLAFFDTHVKGEQSALLTDLSPAYQVHTGIDTSAWE